ncbi:hypothetical protein GBA63_22460 (plasmid) [Rubrobacter tropicus]|uniref:Uncharacterized protein n=1 Tax=Rubrobacter tropicus TaxID=2653851 RepID=A0A6G8QGW6_9ACTN|nr:hypothetical protein [Rubrobacter tropicus]QIN85467.1 hypothetical protein GBA63_22460 [Rubrobacter tropicus]
MRGEIVSDRTYNAHQSWWREVIAIDHHDAAGTNGRTNLRYTVRYNAYRFQSSGVVERWSGSSWEAVHRIAGEQLQGYDRVSYVSETCDPAVFEDDLLELDRVAGMVLGLD